MNDPARTVQYAAGSASSPGAAAEPVRVESSAMPRALGSLVTARADAIASLLPVAAPTALLGVVAAMSFSHLTTSDTWLALVAGREILEHGLPAVDHLTVLTQGRSWVDQQWLAQLIFYAVERVGGLGLVVAVSLAAVGAAFALAAWAARRRGASPAAILLFFAAAIVAAPWVLEVRTQALALPLFSLTLWLLLRDPDAERRSTLWALPVLCLWANLHGSVVVGAGIVLAYGLRALVLGRRRRLAAAFLLAPAAALASPYALSLPGYYRLMLLHPPFGQAIEEWQRTRPSAGTAVFFVLLAVVALLAVFRARRCTTLDVLLLAATAAGALLAVRSIVWFGLTALALAPSLVTRTTSTVRFRGAAAAALAALACSGIVASGAWAATRTYEPGSAAGVLGAVRDHGRGRLVFSTDLDFADWLLWRLPELRGRLAYDARVELLTRRQVGRILTVVRLSPGWESALRRYSLVVTGSAAGTRMVATREWRRLYAGKAVVVVER